MLSRARDSEIVKSKNSKVESDVDVTGCYKPLHLLERRPEGILMLKYLSVHSI